MNPTAADSVRLQLQGTLVWGRGTRREGKGGEKLLGPEPPCLGVQAPSPTPAACLSATTPMKGQLPQREQPRSDATVNTQLVRACPRHGTNDPPKINPKQQIRHNQHAATHTV